jgi:RimJ/RimL family protein N-acetyltransferase
VLLRNFLESDEETVHGYASDHLVTKYTHWGPNTRQDTHAFINEAVAEAQQDPRQAYTLAITLANSGKLIGSAAVWVTDPTHRRGELGYVLERNSWSQGYATETTRLLLRIGFDKLRLHRIAATCHPENAASIRVLTKAGMQFEGKMTHHLFARGTWRDSCLFAAIETDATTTPSSHEARETAP